MPILRKDNFPRIVFNKAKVEIAWKSAALFALVDVEIITVISRLELKSLRSCQILMWSKYLHKTLNYLSLFL